MSASNRLFHLMPSSGWKGRIFNVSIPVYRKNVRNVTNSDKVALPYTHPRLEIADYGSECTTDANPRFIQNRYPGSVRYTSNGESTGFIDAPIWDTTQSNCLTEGICDILNPRQVALVRARKKANDLKQYDPNTGVPKQFYSTSEYLKNRNKTYEQRNYHYLLAGDSNALPGDPASRNNVYTPAGPETCPKYHISADIGNNTFVYVWDITEITVTIPDGWYSFSNFRNLFRNIMIENNTYYIHDTTGERLFLIDFVHDSNADRIAMVIGEDSDYSGVATDQYGGSNAPVVSVNFSSSNFGSDGLGFLSMSDYTVGRYVSEKVGHLANSYRRTYYKPSNPQFATNGAVSGAERILRLQYNTMNTTALSYRIPFGQGDVNAMAYGVPRDKVVAKTKYDTYDFTHPRFNSSGDVTCTKFPIYH